MRAICSSRRARRPWARAASTASCSIESRLSAGPADLHRAGPVAAVDVRSVDGRDDERCGSRAVRVVRLPGRVDPVRVAARQAASAASTSGWPAAATSARPTSTARPGRGVAVAVVTLDVAKGGCAVLTRAPGRPGHRRAGGVRRRRGHRACVSRVARIPRWQGRGDGLRRVRRAGARRHALAGLVFVVTVWWTRYVSLGSVGAAVAAAAAGVPAGGAGAAVLAGGRVRGHHRRSATGEPVAPSGWNRAAAGPSAAGGEHRHDRRLR